MDNQILASDDVAERDVAAAIVEDSGIRRLEGQSGVREETRYLFRGIMRSSTGENLVAHGLRADVMIVIPNGALFRHPNLLCELSIMMVS